MITVSKYNVRIVSKGDKWGRDFLLTHDQDGDKAMVEFYDARFPDTEFGRYIGNYYVGTLLCKEGFHGRDVTSGLCLYRNNYDGEMTVSSEDMKTVLDYISGVAA